MQELLQKMGHSYKDGIVESPSWRTDILHEMDLIEDIDLLKESLILIREGASDEKRMAVSWLQSFKEKLESGQLQLN